MSKFRLSELGEFKNGANYPKGSYGEGDKIINVKDLFKGRYIPTDKLEELKSDALKDKTIYLVQNGDILFTRSSLVRSGAGMCAMATNVQEDILYCGFIIRYRVNNPNVYPLYLLYLLRSPQYRKLFTSTQQTNITNINQETLGAIEVEIPTDEHGNPDINKQIEHVKIIDAIDTKIENNNKTISELESVAKTLYDYWFLQFEFPNEEGKPYKSSGGKMVWNEELKRDIPEGWQTVKGSDLFSFEKGKIPAELFNNNNKNLKPYITIEVANLQLPQYCNPEKMPCCNGETIMVMDGAASGDVYVGINGVLGSTFSMLKPMLDNLSNEMVYMILLTNKPRYIAANTGSTVPHANRKFIENMKFAVPRDIKSFSDNFKDIFEQIYILRKENQQLTSLRDFLLPMLMNGQVTFKKEGESIA